MSGVIVHTCVRGIISELTPRPQIKGRPGLEVWAQCVQSSPLTDSRSDQLVEDEPQIILNDTHDNLIHTPKTGDENHHQPSSQASTIFQGGLNFFEAK